MLIPWIVAGSRQQRITRVVSAPSAVYVTGPDGTEYPVAIPCFQWQTTRQCNVVGRFSVALPVDFTLDDAGTVYTSAIETGWKITIRQEYNGPHGAVGSMLTNGVVEKNSFAIVEGGAAIVLQGSFKGTKKAREEIHAKQSYVNVSAQAIAGGVLGVPVHYGQYLKDTKLTIDFNAGTRLAAALALGEAARWTLRETWNDDFEFVGVDQSPASGFTFVSLEATTVDMEGAASAGMGIIADRPTIDFDGAALCNRIIPFGVDGDGSDLTLEHAAPGFLPFPILSDGGVFYLEDTTSQLRYDTWEKRIYWSEVRNPETFPATGLLTLTVNVTDGDNLTVAGKSYTFKNAPSALGHIFIGSDVFGTRQNLIAAFNGQDGLNTPNADVQISTFDANHLELRALKAKGADGNFVTTTGTFANPANGFLAASLAGGEFSVATATTLYWRAVNDLLLNRSPIFAFHDRIANGADIWALPGDHVRLRYRGFARTLASGGKAFTWIDIDKDMLILARTDSSDASGVRQVDFSLTAPSLAWPVPGIPNWGGAVALPVPKEIPVPGPLVYKDPAMATMMANLASRTGLPFQQCCPDPNVTHSGGAGELSPVSTGGEAGGSAAAAIQSLNYPALAAVPPTHAAVAAGPAQPLTVTLDVTAAVGKDQSGILLVGVVNRANAALTTANHLPGGGDYLYIGNQGTPEFPLVPGFSQIQSVTFRAQQSGSYVDPVDSHVYNSDGDDARLTVFSLHFDANSPPTSLEVIFGGIAVPDVLVYATAWPLPDTVPGALQATVSGGGASIECPAQGPTKSAIVFATGNVGSGAGFIHALGAASLNMVPIGSVAGADAFATAGWIGELRAYKVLVADAPTTIALNNLIVTPGAGAAMVSVAIDKLPSA